MSGRAPDPRRARRLWFDNGPLPDARETVAVRLFEVVQGGSFDTVVKQLTRHISDLTGIVGPVIVLIDPHTRMPTFAGGTTAVSGVLAAVEQARRRGATMSIWQAYTRNQIVLERNWRHRAMTDPMLASVKPFVAQIVGPDLADLVVLPLRWDGATIGVIAGMVHGRMADPGVLVRWQHIAFETALALRYHTAIQEARHASIDHERLRIREELHGGVSQRLFAASLLVARAESDAGRSAGGPALVPQLRELRSVLAEASAAVRVLIAEAHPRPDETPLSPRLAALVEEFADPDGLEVRLDTHPGWNDLNRECADDIVRIVRECLRNVVKHARATRVSVTLPAATADGVLLIEVADNGAGFDPNDVRQASFGLSLITERALGRGGRCDVHVDSSGTTMRVRMVPEYESDWEIARRALERALPPENAHSSLAD